MYCRICVVSFAFMYVSRFLVIFCSCVFSVLCIMDGLFRSSSSVRFSAAINAAIALAYSSRMSAASLLFGMVILSVSVIPLAGVMFVVFSVHMSYASSISISSPVVGCVHLIIASLLSMTA